MKVQTELEQTRKDTQHLKETHSATESKLQVFEKNLNLKDKELAKLKDLNTKLTKDYSEKNYFKSSGLILQDIPVSHLDKESQQLNFQNNSAHELCERGVSEHYRKDSNITDDSKLLSYIAQIEEMRKQVSKLEQDKLDLSLAVDELKKSNTELNAVNISFKNKEKEIFEETSKISEKKLEDINELKENFRRQCNELNEKYISENKEKQLIAVELLNGKKDSFELRKKFKDLEEKYNDLILVKNSSENSVDEKTDHIAAESLQNHENSSTLKLVHIIILIRKYYL